MDMRKGGSKQGGRGEQYEKLRNWRMLGFPRVFSSCTRLWRRTLVCIQEGIAALTGDPHAEEEGIGWRQVDSRGYLKK